MPTLVVSDLHLGSQKRSDLLRRPDLRAPLLEAVAGVDRLVILGDGLELRENAQRDAAELAGDVFADLGRALGVLAQLEPVAEDHEPVHARHGLEQRRAQIGAAQQVRVLLRAEVEIRDDERRHWSGD